jgi:hypothetical protein
MEVRKYARKSRTLPAVGIELGVVSWDKSKKRRKRIEKGHRARRGENRDPTAGTDEQ